MQFPHALLTSLLGAYNNYPITALYAAVVYWASLKEQQKGIKL